ncbi:MAG: DnaD domain protein [Ardenticatenaceae bacterium]|nr:DnaD domain protein [Ardenticatenaceae bacterium]HBY93620.1 primosomal replication protein N [Chloroflexota bacterium]
MSGFFGFPPGRVRFTAVPDLFFSELLVQIDDLAELKLTLHAIWRLYRQKGHYRYLSRQELEQDGLLLQGLKRPGQPALAVLDEALERAVARGTLLKLLVQVDGQPQEWYLLNTERSRQVMSAIEQGDLAPQTLTVSAEVIAVPAERPNIFRLYEQNVGLLQPLIAEELREAATSFPEEWIEEAFRLAAQRNVRTWSYIRSILERWARKGRDDGTGRRQSQENLADRTRRRFRDELE